MPEVRWRPTSHEAYACLYIRHQDDLVVFSTYTCTEGDGCMRHADTYILTEWGFRDGEYPLIRSLHDGEEWSYWIAEPLPEEKGS